MNRRRLIQGAVALAAAPFAGLLPKPALAMKGKPSGFTGKFIYPGVGHEVRQLAHDILNNRQLDIMDFVCLVPASEEQALIKYVRKHPEAWVNVRGVHGIICLVSESATRVSGAHKRTILSPVWQDAKFRLFGLDGYGNPIFADLDYHLTV